MATGSPFGPHRNAMDADPEIRIRIREIRIFRNFFFAFFASMDLLGPQGHPRMVRNHLIRIRTGKSGFSKIRIFRFFDFLSLKTLQHGCLLTPLDQPKSPVPVPLISNIKLLFLNVNQMLLAFSSFKVPLTNLLGYDLYILSLMTPRSRSEQRRPGGP